MADINYAAIAAGLDPQFHRDDLWQLNDAGECLDYTGPTDPALAWAAFEPLVQVSTEITQATATRLHNLWVETFESGGTAWSFAWWLIAECTPTDRLLALQAALGIGGGDE